MARWGSCDYSQLKRIQQRLERLEKKEFEAFCQECARELAARLLAKVIKRTPVGNKPEWVDDDVLKQHWAGYMGGTLRRGWTAKTEEEAKSGGSKDAAAYAKSLKVNKVGNEYIIEIINPVSYASYVEYGHRQQPGRFVPAIGKRLKQAWVPGKYMLTISEMELQAQAPALLEKKLMKLLGDCFHGQ